MADWNRIVEIFVGRRPSAAPARRRQEQNNPHVVIKKIASTIDLLDKRIDFLLVKIKEEKEIVRLKLRNGDRQLALSSLRMVKGHEKSREAIIRRKDAVIAVRTAIEESAFNKVALDAIKATHTYLKSTKMPSVEDVDNMIEDIVDIRTQTDQMLTDISTALEPVYDEDDLEKELDELMGVPEPAKVVSTVSSAPRRKSPPVVKIIDEDPSPLQREEDEIILSN